MKVFPVSIYSTNNVYQKNNIAPKKQISVKDSVSFSGYKSELTANFTPDIKTAKQAESIFLNLFNIIRRDENIFKSPEFETIGKDAENIGLRGIIHRLWTAVPNESIAKIIEKADNGHIVLAKYNGQPILELNNLGKNGFWDSLTNNPHATNDIRLLFSDGLNKPRTMFEFYMNKDANIIFDQYANETSVYTEFYKETGNRKKQIILGIGNPETTYYKKDGRKDFWNNFFRGGVAIPVY